jgi:NAD(P)-dependent dehydrogenase (short-subunit alcohol dehydrogenase family)
MPTQATAAKTILITGANRGIGQQVARVLATQGWDVLVGARDRKKGDATAKRLREETGGRLRAVELDVTSDESVSTAAQKLRDGAIQLDALVNNAGVYGASASPAQTLETNFFGPLRTTLAMLPLVRDGGSVTNVTSGLGSLANLDARHRSQLVAITDRDALAAQVRSLAGTSGRGWGTDVYGASKAALDQLTRILARELAPRSIRVNSTDPGWARTEMGGRGAPRSIEEGGASVLFGVTTDKTGGVWRDGNPIG